MCPLNIRLALVRLCISCQNNIAASFCLNETSFIMPPLKPHFFNARAKRICTISTFLPSTSVSLNLTKSSSNVCQRASRSGTKLAMESFAIQHPSFVRLDLWNTADDSVLLARYSLSLSLSFSPWLSFSIHLSGVFSPSTFPSQPPPECVRGKRRITASSCDRLSALGNNPHGPNILSSPHQSIKWIL